MTPDAPRYANSFTLVATAASLLVCIRHSGVLLGPEEPTRWLARTPSIGLAVLLATSGWLLVHAWDRDARVGAYALRRALRVWPSLVAVVAASALIVGPLASTLPWREYLVHPETIAYVGDNVLLRVSYSLPGVFFDNPYPNVVNGSLWSLPAQILCFAIVPIVGNLPARWRWGAWAALAGVAAAVLASGVADGLVVWAAPVEQSMIPITAFATGAAFASARLRVPAWIAAAAIGIFALLAHFAPGGASVVAMPLLLATAAVGFGLMDHRVLCRITPRRNVSLGIFLLGFPMQQVLIWLVPTLPAVLSLLMTLLLTIVGAVVIDLVVERPVQAFLRRVVPRPGDEVRRAVPSPRTPIA